MEKTALDRINGYIAARESRPIRNIDDCIHSLHSGESFEGKLLYSDIKEVVSLLHDTVEALEWMLVDGTPDHKCGGHGGSSCTCICATDKARAAIAKATGKGGE